MFQTLKSWLTTARTTKPTSYTRRFAPQVEKLHDRITPASLGGGDLYVNGTVGNDTVFVSLTGGFYKVTEVSSLDPSRTKETYIEVGRVTGGIVFYGDVGNDYFFNATALGVHAYCGNDNDTVYSGSGRDRLYGEAGDDTLVGGTAGADFLFGGDGHDWMSGGDDANYLEGGVGQDTLFGGGGNDILDGGFGSDNLHGGDGHDYLMGGNEERYAHLYSNHLYGGGGNDTLVGSEGADVLYGEAGADVLKGFGGNDTLVGGTGYDQLYGMAGNDTLDGGVGDGVADYLNGGIGADWFRRDLVSYGSGTTGGYVPAFNRDRPVDFNVNEDVYYS